MKLLKKIPAGIICICMLTFSMLSAGAQAQYDPGVELKSEAVYFVNTDTGRVLYEKNKDEKICPASLTKMMTVILTLETANQEDMESFLNQTVTAKPYIFDRLFGLNASSADIRPNEELPMKDVLYGAMLASGCEATMILSDYVCGENTGEFVQKMNDKAKEIGMENTVFVDPDGLDEATQRSTAYDMYLLTSYCMSNPTFAQIATTQQYMMAATNKHPEQRRIQHTNHMTSPYLGGKYYDERVQGIKTGTAAGVKNLISMASDNNYHYILVTLGAPDDGSNGTYTDAIALYDWAFSNFRFVSVAQPGEKIVPNHIKVQMGKDADTVMLTPTEQIVELLPKNIDPSSIQWDTSKLPETLDAPIRQGQMIGQVDLKLADQVIQTVDVMAAQDVERSWMAFIGKTAKDVVTSWWFWLIAAAAAALVLAYVLVVVRHNRQRKNGSRAAKSIRRKW